jgi:hypothetical protein
MGLQIWLPLDGSFDNKGLMNTKLTTPANYSGWSTISKIGTKGFTNGTIIMDAETTGKIYNNKEMTFAFWFYANAADGTSTGNCIIGNGGMPGSNNRKFAIFNYQTINDLHWSWQNDGIEGGTNGPVAVGGSKNDSLPSYKWTHVILAYKNPTMTLYINGKAVATATGIVNNATYEYSTPILNLNSYQIVNDLRIYDNCLSAKEAAELARGLVGHWPLHNNYDCMPNILTNGSTEISSAAYNTQIYYTESAPVAGEVYTLTMCVTPAPGVTHFSPYLSAGYKSAGNITVSGTGTQIVTHTFTAAYYSGREPSVSASYGYIYIYRFPKEGVTGETTIHWAKLEKGNKATSFCPHSSETPQGNKVYDCSGYERHGSIYGSPTINNDSIRHNCCTAFSGSQAINCGRGAMVTDEITVNLWVYLDDWANFNNNIRVISCTEGGGWNIESYGHFPCYAGGAYQIAKGNFQSASPGWHMITGMFDGFQSRIYLDGVLKASSTALSTKTPITYHGANSIFIGAEAAGSASTPTSPYFTGKISDVRIYATALSATDLLELYQVSVSIDEEGGVYGYNFKEV